MNGALDHSDEIGNVLALTGRNGVVNERDEYGDYGEPAVLTSDGIPRGQIFRPRPMRSFSMAWSETM